MDTGTIADIIYRAARAERPDGVVTRRAAKAITNDLLARMVETLINGDEVRLHGVGTIHSVHSKRMGLVRLPGHEGTQPIRARPTLKIRTVKALRDHLPRED